MIWRHGQAWTAGSTHDLKDMGEDVRTTQQARVWLITGCSTGFGRELVRAAVAAGDRVMATARRPEALADLADLGRGRVSTTALDVTDPASIEAAVEATLAVYGRIDVLVNNAGHLLFGAVEESSAWTSCVARWRRSSSAPPRSPRRSCR